jgi:hypothetical protein
VTSEPFDSCVTFDPLHCGVTFDPDDGEVTPEPDRPRLREESAASASEISGCRNQGPTPLLAVDKENGGTRVELGPGGISAGHSL